MATNLQNFAYMGRTRPAANKASAEPKKSPTSKLTETMADTKAEILASIKEDISVLLRSELKGILAQEFDGVKSEIQVVKNEVVNNISLLRSDLDCVKCKVTDMEHSLTTCSDDVSSLQSTVGKLQVEIRTLQEKCVDMEGRMRRSNIRILNVPEEPDSSSPSSVSKILKEVFQMDREVMIDRSHRSPQLQRVRGKPRPIIAKLHYHQDCVDILRRARQAGGNLKYGTVSISIFPDYPPSVARARSAFNEVKQLLRGQSGVRYGVIHPAKFRISHNGIEKDFLDPDKAMSYVKMSVITASPADNGD